MSRLFLSVVVAMACVSSAHGAPSSPRNNKALVIKQTIFEDGSMRQGAALATPTVLGSKDPNKRGEMMRDTLGAIPLADSVLSAKIPAVGRINFADMFAKIAEIQNYQQALQDQYSSDLQDYYSGSYGDPGSVYDNCYKVSTYCMRGQNFASQANAYYMNLDPSYALAVAVRQNVPDAASGSESAVIYAQNLFIQTAPEPKAFKQALINYLRESNIEYAWADLETEVTINGIRKRVASSLQVGRSDTINTPGQYLGAALIPAPGVNVASGRRNTIDITYTTRSQYPDIFNSDNANDPVFSDKTNFGVLSWMTVNNGDPMDGTGSSYVQTNGAYDDIFHDEDISTSGSPEMVRSINNTNQLELSTGITCLYKPLSDNCISGFPNISTLMAANNASTGTLTYRGRWELQHESIPGQGETSFPPLTNDAQETLRGVEYNLCADVKFYNQIKVQYKIRRLITVYDIISNDGQISLLPKAGYPKWETENYTLPNYTTYTSYGEISKPRDPNSSSSPALSGLTEDVLANNVIINPMTWSAAHSSLAPYTQISDASGSIIVPQELTWQRRFSQVQPVALYRSASLPSYVPDPTARYFMFTCDQRNVDEINSIRASADQGSVAVSGDLASCQASWTTTSTVNTNSDPNGPAIWNTTVTPHKQMLGNPACEESCPADGSSPVVICPRP